MGWMAPTIMAGGSVLGGMFGGGGQEQFGPGDAIPKHLKEDWRNAGSQIMDLQNPEYYKGQLNASQNPMWSNSLAGMNQFGQPGGAGAYGANMSNMGGMAGMNAMGNGLQYLDQLRQQGPQQFNYDQGTYDQVMGNLMPGLQGQFDAAMRDPQRQFQEQTLPGINMGSIGSGSQFGTKSFNQGAIANRGLQDRAADTGASLYANAANQANQAAYGAGGLNMQAGQNLQNNLMSQYGNYAQLGGNLLNQGYNMGAGNLEMQNRAGLQQQGYDQSLIDSEMARWNFNQQSPWTSLNNRLQMMGQQSTMPTQSGVNTGFANAMNGGQAALGLYNAYQQAQQPWGGYNQGQNNNMTGAYNSQAVNNNPMYDLRG